VGAMTTQNVLWVTRQAADGTREYQGEDGVWRPDQGHLQHLHQILISALCEPSSHQFDDDYARRIRGMADSLARQMRGKS
jgi:hypothetical protein